MTTERRPTERISTVASLLRLVGNPMAYAVQDADGSWKPVREPLTTAVLRRHLAGELTVGTYVIRPPDTARTLVFDIDATTIDERQRQLIAVETALTQSTDIGTRHAAEWSGGKGYHVWVLVAGYVPAEALYRIGRGVRELAGLPNLEVFPKQTRVDVGRTTRTGGSALGNLVKLPGGIHRKTGNEYDFVSRLPKPVPVAEIMALAEKFPEVRASRVAGDALPVEFPCVWRIQDGLEEGGRNIAMFHLATMLRRKGTLNDENLELVLRAVNEKNDPPLEEEELVALIASSRNSGPICRQLPDEVSCGDQCVFERSAPGLYTRGGTLKYAEPGEMAVVEVVERTPDGVLELGHPDIEQARAHLREAPKQGGRGRRQPKSQSSSE